MSDHMTCLSGDGLDLSLDEHGNDNDFFCMMDACKTLILAADPVEQIHLIKSYLSIASRCFATVSMRPTIRFSGATFLNAWLSLLADRFAPIPEGKRDMLLSECKKALENPDKNSNDVFDFICVNDDDDGDDSKIIFNADKFRNFIVRNFGVSTEGSTIISYTGYGYRRGSAPLREICERVRALSGFSRSQLNSADVIKAIEDFRGHRISGAKPGLLVPCVNGILRLRQPNKEEARAILSGEFKNLEELLGAHPGLLQWLPHSKSIITYSALPVRFVLKQQSEELRQAFEDWADGELEEAMALLEGIGTSLVTKIYKTAFMLIGRKDGGKTSFLNLLNCFFGVDEPFSNVANVSPADFEKRFYAADLDGKMINIVDEVETKDVNPKGTAMLKAATGGSRIKAELKGVNPWNFSPTAKTWLAGNEVPDYSSSAMVQRFICFPFRHCFPKTSCGDWTKHTGLYSHENMSALLNDSIMGLFRVEARTALGLDVKFSQSPGMREMTRELYDQTVDPVIKEWISSLGENPIQKLTPKSTGSFELKAKNIDVIYGLYKAYCIVRRIDCATKKGFESELASRFGLMTAKFGKYNKRCFCTPEQLQELKPRSRSVKAANSADKEVPA